MKTIGKSQVFLFERHFFDLSMNLIFFVNSFIWFKVEIKKVALLYGLMSRRRRKDYTVVLAIIKQLLQFHSKSALLKLQEIVMDFERIF